MTTLTLTTSLRDASRATQRLQDDRMLWTRLEQTSTSSWTMTLDEERDDLEGWEEALREAMAGFEFELTSETE